MLLASIWQEQDAKRAEIHHVGNQTKDPPRQKALTRQKTLLDKRPSDKTPSDKRPSYELFFWNGGGSFVRADGQKALLMY